MIYPILTPVPAHCRRVMVFDVETTGLVPRNIKLDQITPEMLLELPHIIQLSFAVYNIVSNRIEKTYNAYISVPEEVVISERITEITGITREIIREKGKPIVPVLELFYQTYTKCDMVIAHNLSFDQTMIGIEIERNAAAIVQSPSAVCSIADMKALFTYAFNEKHSIDLYCTMMATISLCRLPNVRTVSPPILVEETSLLKTIVDAPTQMAVNDCGILSPVTIPKFETIRREDTHSPVIPESSSIVAPTSKLIKPILRRNTNYDFKYPRLSELHNVLFGAVPENLHNAMVDVLVCLRCFLKIRCCLDVPEKSFDRMLRNAL